MEEIPTLLQHNGYMSDDNRFIDFEADEMLIKSIWNIDDFQFEIVKYLHKKCTSTIDVKYTVKMVIHH